MQVNIQLVTQAFPYDGPESFPQFGRAQNAGTIHKALRLCMLDGCTYLFYREFPKYFRVDLKLHPNG